MTDNEEYHSWLFYCGDQGSMGDCICQWLNWFEDQYPHTDDIEGIKSQLIAEAWGFA